MDKEEKKPKTMKLSIILSLILSISIIVLILYFTIDAKTFEYLSTHQIRYEFFFAAMGINVIYWTLWGARLKILSNAIDKNVNISLWESTKIVIANLFLANITPSMAGGEPVRIYLLNKDGLSVGGATASVLGERLLDAIFLLLCVPFALFVFGKHIDTGPLRIGLTIAIVIFILAVIAFAYALKNPKKTKSFLIFLSNKLSRFSKKKDSENTIIDRINSEVDNFHDSMVFFLSDGKKVYYLVEGGIEARKEAVAESILRNKNARDIMMYLQDNPGKHLLEIAHALDLNHHTVKWHIKKMYMAELVDGDTSNSAYPVYYPTEIGSQVIQNFSDQFKKPDRAA